MVHSAAWGNGRTTLDQTRDFQGTRTHGKAKFSFTTSQQYNNIETSKPLSRSELGLALERSPS